MKRYFAIVALAVFSALIVCGGAEAALTNWTSSAVGFTAIGDNQYITQFDPLPSNYAYTPRSEGDFRVTMLFGQTAPSYDMYFNARDGISWIGVGQYPAGAVSRDFGLGNFENFPRFEDDVRHGLLVMFTYGLTPPILTGTLTIYNVDQVSSVPIPGAMWLLGSGLLGLVALRRRMKK